MPVTAVELTLQRPGPGPWGLRLQGGLDYDKALVISHVTEGTPSSQSGLMVQCIRSSHLYEFRNQAQLLNKACEVPALNQRTVLICVDQPE